MKEGTRERLKIAVTMLDLQQSEIAKLTGYAQANISNILNKGEPTLKFINIFCMAFPKVNRVWILENEGIPLIGEDVSRFGFIHTADTVKVSFMEQQIANLTAQVTFLQGILEKAMSIYPDLAGKLHSSLTLHGQITEKNNLYLPLRDLTRVIATLQTSKM
jgi:predicted transcriptional regulator